MSAAAFARPELTARQMRFAQHYVLTQHAADAYRAAYDCEGWPPKKVGVEANNVLRSPSVRLYIRELQDQLVLDGSFTAQKALSYFVQIAMADPNEVVSLRIGACRYCHGVEHRRQWREHEYLAALTAWEASPGSGAMPDPAGGLDYDETAPPHPDCPVCHGEGEPRTVLKDTTQLSPEGMLLYGGVKQTANGLQIILADRMKAMELACRLIGAFNDNVTVKAELKAMATVITAATPEEAARVYMDMVADKLPAT